MHEATLHAGAEAGIAAFTRRLRRAGNASGAFTMLVGLCAVFALAAEGFGTASNLVNIGVQSSLLLLLALPMTLIILTEGLDLSMGAVLTLANVVLATMAARTGTLGVALLAAIAVSVAFGFLNGLLVAVVRIPPFVATLGTLGVAQGLALAATDGQSVVGIPQTVQAVYAGSTIGVPTPLWIALVACALMHVLLHRTRFGARVFALGGNREALTLAGLPARRYEIAVYALAGLMVGVASLLLTARINSGHPTAALGMEFDAIAAVALGGTSFVHGKGGLAGTVVGVLAIGVLRNGLNLLGVPSAAQVSAIGALVIVALTIDALRRRMT